jgi:HlyD family secretion protein
MATTTTKVESAEDSRHRSWVLPGAAVLLLIGTAAIAAWWLTPSRPRQSFETQVVQKGRLMVTIANDGNLESGSNAELKCQVQGGARIISIVPDGTQVQAGAELVQLDRSTFEDQLNAERIIYERAVATKIQAEQDYEAAAVAVREYESGTYHKDLQAAEAQITVARQNLDTDKNVLSHSERMFRKGFVTNLQLEADKFAVEHAQLDLDSALIAKRVLEKFTKLKTLKQLESVRDAADARRRAEQASVNLEKTKLDRIKEQLKHCVLRAPQPGMVIYANDPDQNVGRAALDSPQIEEGAMVRERQIIIRLPNLNEMQVRTTVHESHVPHIRPGMAARVTIQDHTYNGCVKSIANRPAPPQRFAAPTKNYNVFVAVDPTAKGLRPGMSAQVEILLADLHDVYTVPVTSVVEDRGQFFTWVTGEKIPQKRAVTLGKTDDKVIEIVQGLNAGDVVVTNPRATIPEAMHVLQADAETLEDDSRFHPAELKNSKPQGETPSASKAPAAPGVSQAAS